MSRDDGAATTERLALERWDPDRHTEALVATNRDPEVMRFVGDGVPAARAESAAQSAAIAAHWERFGFGLWALRLRERDEVGGSAGEVGGFADVVGFAGLSHPLWWPARCETVEVGWRLRRDAWGHGYATEAARAAIELAFSALALEQLFSYIDTGNARSQAVARRLGMRLEQVVPHPRRPKTVEVWELRAERSRRAGG